MKKLFSAVLALFLLVMALIPAHATLANSSTYTPYVLGQGNVVHYYSALITATSNDTTATADSNTIFNQNGDIKAIAAGVKATNQTGTSPTLTVSLIASFDNSTWFTVQSVQASTAGTTADVATSALSISTASTTNVSTGLDTVQFGLSGINYPYLRVRVTVGGSASPGWTGVAYAAVKRGK